MEKLPNIKTDLVIQELEDELLVFDPGTDKAHCLSGTGALVLKACRSQQEPAELIASLRGAGLTEPETALRESLNQMGEEGLVTNHREKFDRRRFLAAAGTAAAMLPVLSSVMAPRPAQALSCVNCTLLGGGFSPPADCTDCGKKCPAGAGCSVTATCCFEYRLNPSNGGKGTGCQASELVGNFACRIPPTLFRVSCSQARDDTIDAGGVLGTLYYCCSCPANAPFSCL